MKKHTPHKKQPNILLCIVDQWNYRCLGFLDHPDVKTPNLDRFSQESVVFSSAYCASMACVPSRSCIFSGLEQHHHGAVNNDSPFRDPDQVVLPQLLQQAGYDTALVGKLHLHPFHRDYGFRYMLRNDAPYTNYLPAEAEESAYVDFLADAAYDGDKKAVIERFSDDEGAIYSDEQRFILGTNVAEKKEFHESEWCVEEAIRYLAQERDKEKPFFLNVGFFGPHQPYLAPPPFDQSSYPAESLELPPGFDADVSDRPRLFEDDLRKRRQARNPSELWYKEMLAAYYGYISLLDFSIARLFDWLKANDLWDNTAVIFTADHGDYAGQFRMFFKGTAHEGAAHVPLMVKEPDQKLGRKIIASVSNLDLFRYCLNLANAPTPSQCDSRDLFEQAKRHNAVAWFECAGQIGMVRYRHKLIRTKFKGKTNWEFYDLERDPGECVNAFFKPEYIGIIERMQHELLAHFSL